VVLRHRPIERIVQCDGRIVVSKALRWRQSVVSAGVRIAPLHSISDTRASVSAMLRFCIARVATTPLKWMS
jgi:hypothetical protein